ncbi:MAG TPA: glycosyltransferase family A protein [Rhizomicrobium sp.]|nr:glycosyltransferase family A protein [Rhizomicrobium sp.]
MTVAFTVVMPTYNRGELIAETLDAVLAQTLPPRQVIVVDGGSTDNTQDVLARYAGRILSKRITERAVQPKRNLGIGLARTDWIALCDSDDIWLPTYLEKQAALITAEPGIGMSFGNFQILRDGAVESGTKFDDAPPGYWEEAGVRHLPQGWVFDRSLAAASFRFHPMFPSAMVISKELATLVGGFNSNIPPRAEDGEFTLRCLYHAKAAALPEPLVHIRRHEANVSRDLVPRLLDEIATLQHAMDNHPEAVAYHPIIHDEIGIRTKNAFHAAFAGKDHVMAAALFEKLPPEWRSAKARVKNIVARMPDCLGRRLNTSLQALVSKQARDPGEG